jgi:hypothetical protein
VVFERAEPTENFPLQRWLSTGGHWEVGLVPMAFGVRIRAGRPGSGSCEIDLCAGADRDLQMEVLRLVMIILLPVEEDISYDEFRYQFPCRSSAIKPVNLDPCLDALRGRAYEILKAIKDGELKQVVGGSDGGVPATDQVHGAQTPQ